MPRSTLASALVLLAVLAMSCSEPSADTALTSAGVQVITLHIDASTTTTATIPIELEVPACLQHSKSASRDYAEAHQLPTPSAPLSDESWAEWAVEFPIAARRVCSALYGPKDEPGQVTIVAGRHESQILAQLLESEGAFVWSDLANHGVEDGAIVWCSSHGFDVLSAADTLGLDWQSAQADVGRLQVVGEADWHDIRTSEGQAAAWTIVYPELVARACEAAFSAR